MKTSKQGLDLIKKYEGLRLTTYKCAAGIFTIGYGHTKGVKANQTITEEEADKLLLEDVKVAEKAVNKYQNQYNFNQNEYDALVSFAFNVGNIKGLTNNGKRTKFQISSKFKAYVYAGGKRMRGLERRRADEAALFVSTPNLQNSYEIGEEYKVCVSSLRVRKEPTVNSDLVQKTPLRINSKVKVLSVIRDTEGNTWIKHSKGYSAAIYNGKYYIK